MGLNGVQVDPVGPERGQNDSLELKMIFQALLGPKNQNQKMCFLRLWTWKLSLSKIGLMDMSYIMDSGQNRLYTTFHNIFSLLSADPSDLSHIQKIIFMNKIPYFWIENVLQKDQNWLYKKAR